MGWLLLRLVVVGGAVLIGHWRGGLVGGIVGACVGTVLVTQTADVLRIVARVSQAGGAGFVLLWRVAVVFFGHTLVRRLLRTFVLAVLVGALTSIANSLGGQLVAILTAALSATLGQALLPGGHLVQGAGDPPHHAA